MPVCEQCGGENPEQASFCNACGSALPESGFTCQERRRVTVLFADIVGFTKLSGEKDPEEIAELTDGVYKVMGPAIDRFEGTIDKYMGDGVMAIFGAPSAGEHGGERACLCALEMKRQIKKYSAKIGVDLSLTIGINSGLVVAGHVGSTDRRDYTVIGDVVNVAQRFEKFAQNEQIIVSHNLYKELKDRFEWGEESSVEIKGKNAPLRVHELKVPARPVMFKPSVGLG